MLIATAAVLAITVLYVGLWEPASEGSKRLTRELPELRAELESMRAQKAELARLKTAPKQAALPAGQLRDLIRKSAETSGLGTNFVRLDAGTNGLVQVSLAKVPFDAWLRWVDTLQRQYRLGLDSARVETLGEPGMVRVEAVFAAAQ